VVEDTSAPDLWARFYEIGTNQPIFSDRDGVAKRTLAEIGYERRNGYSWLSNWPSTLLTKDYPAWKARISKTKILPPALPWQPRVRIALVGDSTVKDDGGWGFGFKKHLAADTLCINLAQAGRSSKSYRDEGWWEKALAQKPDYMLIQFGHNDQPGKGPTRETDPATTFPENMGRYVDEARAAGIMPVLVTSMTRRKFGEDGKIASDLVAYAEAVKNVAAEKRVPLIDLHARSIAALDKLGPKASEDFDRVPHSREVEPSATPPGEVASASSSPEPSASPAPPTRDKTHLSPKGSDVMGAIAAKELGSVVPELKRALR
jgi:lysophospholipase L1-like esterase